MVIWRGWGILSVAIAAIFFFAGGYLGSYFFGVTPGRHGALYGVAVGLVVAAVANWFAGNSLNRPLREAGVGIWKQHTLFFMPMQWTSSVMLMGAVMFAMMAGEP